MQSLESVVAGLFLQAIKNSFPALKAGVKPLITPGRDISNGEFHCNNAMQMPKLLKEENISDAPKTPGDIGKLIVENLPQNDVILGANVAPQGFINIKIKKEYVGSMLHSILKGGLLPPPQKKQRVLVDFSSPNIAKEMHVGHLRSTIIGESLCRVFEFCGHDVVRVNHVGDWGTQFGMLIAHLKDTFPDFKTTTPPISDLVGFYKESKKRFDADPDFKDRAHKEVVALQGGDEDNLKAWRLICEVSRVEFEKIYKRLDVRLEEKGESFYNPFMPDMVQELLDRKLAKVNEGATVIVSGERKLVSAIAPADVERVLQYYYLNSPLSDQPPLIELLKGKKIIMANKEGAECLNAGTAKKEQLFELTKISQALMDLASLGKCTKAIGEALVKTEKTKQGPKHTVDPDFVALVRSVPDLVTTDGDAEKLFVPKFSHPYMIRKRDGGFTYDTTDMAALRYRVTDEKVERVVYVTDSGQEGHFMMLFAAAQDAGYINPETHHCDHVGFGLVVGPDGKKLKTRSGETIRLVDLLDEAPRRSYEESVKREQEKRERAQERGEEYKGLTEEELRSNAEVIGYGAAKYFDLRQNRLTDYRFNYDDMLNLEGNTAVALIYAYVRMRSIARKAGLAETENVLAELEKAHPAGLSVSLVDEREWTLGLHLMRFAYIVDRMTEELLPNQMCDFLYTLTKMFNDFYQNVPILKSEDRDQKLLLCEVTAKILKEGLHLLGINVVEKL